MSKKTFQRVINEYFGNANSDAVAMEKAIIVENFFSLIRDNKKEEIESILKRTPDALYYVNNLRQTTLHTACRYNRPEILSLFLEKLPKNIRSADRFIDKRDTEGFTALMVCADNNCPECAKMLMEHKPNLQIVGYDLKRNVAHLAAQKNAHEILSMVLSVKTKGGKVALDVNEPCQDREYYGFTAAHFSASNFAHKSIRVLKNFSADFNAQALKNKTPLMIALQSGSQEVVSYLLEQSEIDLMLRDTTGHLAYHYALLYRAPKKYVKQIKSMIEKQFQIENPRPLSKHRLNVKRLTSEHTK